MGNLRRVSLVALLVLGAVSSMYSLPANEVYTEFYSDDTYSEVVGWKYRGCLGGGSQSGVTSDYRRIETTSCSSNEYDCRFVYCFWTSNGTVCQLHSYC
jgi:hypothetical protein